MTLILETGSGLRIANSYVLTSFVTSYLTERGRETENEWSTATSPQQEAGAIAATQYIDTRWGTRLKGDRQTRYEGSSAQALVSFSGIPVADETITLGNQTYIWKASLSTLGNNEIIIGANADECATNLIAAINSGATAGTNYSKFLLGNDAATALLEEGSSTSILLTARNVGLSGNDIVLSETSTNFDIDNVFVNGNEEQSQALEFPRAFLFDRDGNRLISMPLKLKQATAEYSVRARGAALYVDPVVDDTGRTVTEKMEKLGPIEESTKFTEGSALSQLIRPYPAADQLLAEYILPSGRVFR